MAIKQLDSVYKKIFHEHKNARLYTLTEEARQRLIRYEEDTRELGSKVLENALKFEFPCAIPQT